MHAGAPPGGDSLREDTSSKTDQAAAVAAAAVAVAAAAVPCCCVFQRPQLSDDALKTNALRTEGGKPARVSAALSRRKRSLANKASMKQPQPTSVRGSNSSTAAAAATKAAPTAAAAAAATAKQQQWVYQDHWRLSGEELEHHHPQGIDLRHLRHQRTAATAAAKTAAAAAAAARHMRCSKPTAMVEGDSRSSKQSVLQLHIFSAAQQQPGDQHQTETGETMQDKAFYHLGVEQKETEERLKRRQQQRLRYEQHEETQRGDSSTTEGDPPRNVLGIGVSNRPRRLPYGEPPPPLLCQTSQPKVGYLGDTTKRAAAASASASAGWVVEGGRQGSSSHGTGGNKEGRRETV
ncbi:hypothetical protein ACSSS7_007398 [Eimeria intestinalis]